jgi:hypothetical protein
MNFDLDSGLLIKSGQMGASLCVIRFDSQYSAYYFLVTDPSI